PAAFMISRIPSRIPFAVLGSFRWRRTGRAGRASRTRDTLRGATGAALVCFAIQPPRYPVLLPSIRPFGHGNPECLYGTSRSGFGPLYTRGPPRRLHGSPLLAHEVGSGDVRLEGAPEVPEEDHAVGWRAELPGAELPAGPGPDGRRSALLSLPDR